MSSKVACLYIRVSTEDQTELSPDAQKRLLLDYAQKNDMIVSGDFIFTESVSGRHAQKRPEFQKMIALAKQPSHPIDVILVNSVVSPVTRKSLSYTRVCSKKSM